MRSLPSILKYFMKPKAEEYELPDEEQLVSQLEEMIRLKENVPSDDAADEKPAEQAKEAHAAKAEEQEQEIQEPAGGSFEQALSLAQADELIRNARAQAEHSIEEAKQADLCHVHLSKKCTSRFLKIWMMLSNICPMWQNLISIRVNVLFMRCEQEPTC